MRAGRPTRFLRSTIVMGAVTAVALVGVGTASAVGPATDAAPSVPAASPSVGAAGPASPVADDRLLVEVTPETTADQAEAIADRAGATLEIRAGDTLILDPTDSIQASSSGLESMPGVVLVEPNGVLQAFGAPNDPLYPDQYALSNTQPGGIRAEQGWNGNRGSREIVVGVLDSGTSLTHPDLRDNLWTNRTGFFGCAYGTNGWNAIANNCNPADDAGHGTHVAGIVGAVGDNGIGVSGVAQRVSLMSLKMLDANGNGSPADAVEAIDKALSAKASGLNLRVLQASWGTDSSSSALSAAIARSNAAGVLFVAAAGNGIRNDNVPRDLDTSINISPCEDASANVICVASSTEPGQLATSTNFGANAVDIAAPGDRIWSTVPKGLIPACGFQAEYCAFDGTSMAAPAVAGAAVDIIAAEPSISVPALKARILDSAAPLGSLTGKVATNGRLDLCKALPNCDGLPAVAPTVPTDVRAVAGDRSATLRWHAPDSNGNSFIVGGYEVKGPSGVTTLAWNGSALTLTGLTNNQNTVIRVRALGSGGNSPWVSKTVRPHVGGYEVDARGAIHAVGVGGIVPSAASGGPVFPTGLARGIAVLPEGTGGYVVDAYGGLHRFRIGSSSPMPPFVTGGPYWLGWGIVRGVALSPNGGGYVLDGFGGVHRFGFGRSAPPSAAKGGPYWSGFDIGRGITVNAAGTGGYVVDGYGGIHQFRIGGGAQPPAATGGPYWYGWNIVRGITLVPGTGGGYVLDGFGGLHTFRAGGTAPSRARPAPYWSGWDIARGVSL